MTKSRQVKPDEALIVFEISAQLRPAVSFRHNRIGFAPGPRQRFTRVVKFEDYITITPEVRSDKPCIKGTRITVFDVLEYLAGGRTEAEILADFPALRAEHIRACRAFATARERRLASHRAA